MILKTLKFALLGALAGVSFVPTPSDACSYGDPCQLVEATETLGSGTVMSDGGDPDALAPTFLAERAAIVFDGNGVVVAVEIGDRTFTPWSGQ